MANDYKRLKAEAIIDDVVDYLGIPKHPERSLTKILCPIHDDHNPTMYYKKGWDSCYCPACAKSLSAPDLIMEYTGKSFTEACDVLWEIEGRPSWYKEENDSYNTFSTTPEEDTILGIDNSSYIKTIAYESPVLIKGGLIHLEYFCEGYEKAEKTVEYYTQPKLMDIPLPKGWAIPSIVLKKYALLELEKEYTIFAINPTEPPLKIVFIANAYLKKGQEQTFELKEENEIIYDDEIFKYTIWNVNRINRRDFMEDKVYAEYVYTLAINKLEILHIALSSKEYYEAYLYDLSQQNDFFSGMNPDIVLPVYKKEYPIKRLKKEIKSIKAIIKRSLSFLNKEMQTIVVA